MKIIDEFNTTSDLGGVLIGNTDWQVLVPNGYGDGTTKVHIIEFKDFEEELEYVKGKEKYVRDRENGKNYFWYFTVVKGHFGIYPYDAYKTKSELLKPMKVLKGEYSIYYYEQHVYFMTY
ncbi:hypothetical protein NYZ94_00240 (plasmid) [Ligilactobacillus salivarius]|nr:hypothetical protein NYZ94_01465 [Ligilactobacillus salivarius]UXI83680.1 hypothetical protein NYZ94_00240 [Ligilactobacillus salivarius]